MVQIHLFFVNWIILQKVHQGFCIHRQIRGGPHLKGKRFVWNEACGEAFAKLKKFLVSTDIMGYPRNEGGDFVLDVDASYVGIGSVLQQIRGKVARWIEVLSQYDSNTVQTR